MMKLHNKLWIGLAILIVISPLGLLLPEYFKAGSAWGEWGTNEIQKLVGYLPKGLARFSSLWNALIPDYAFSRHVILSWPGSRSFIDSLAGKGWEEKSLGHLSFAYIMSAAIGVLIVALLALIIGKLLAKKGD